MMKLFKILVTILFLFFSFTFSFSTYAGWFDKTICDETDAQERNSVIYLPNKEDGFSGNNLCKFENGQMKIEGTYQDGKKDEKWTTWYENGQKKIEGTYQDGLRNDKWTTWYENGQKKGEGTYRDGIRSDKWTWWFDNGEIEKELTIRNNTICIETDAQIRNDIIYLSNETEPFTGNNLCEYTNRQIKSKGNVKDGKLDGKFTEWYTRGQVRKEEFFINGEYNGIQTAWLEDGSIDYKRDYRIAELPASLFDISILEPISQYLDKTYNGNFSISNKYTAIYEALQLLENFYASINEEKLVNEINAIKLYNKKDPDICFDDKKRLIEIFSDYHNFEMTIFKPMFYEANGITDYYDDRPYIKNSSVINYIKDSKDLVLEIFCEHHPESNAKIQGAYFYYNTLGIVLTTQKNYLENYKKSAEYIINEIDSEAFKSIIENKYEDEEKNYNETLKKLPKLK